ncbi:hypothetical protein FHR32_008522 [Streptosporangium album]|uniref:Uncharacterized protein n=1 Tax=Streptosporangium album TaxID=47479 RepID=A0A7W7S5A1_9ACTN|nr:hypothetical protein [Streptosporangium album]MBB4944119.1 hypothetical protein [Streptosporangium album]
MGSRSSGGGPLPSTHGRGSGAVIHVSSVVTTGPPAAMTDGTPCVYIGMRATPKTA